MAVSTLKIFALTADKILVGEEYVAVRCSEDNEMVVYTFRVLTEPKRDPDPENQTFKAECLAVDGQPFEGDEAVTELSLTDIGCPRKGSPKGIMCRTFDYSRQTNPEKVHEILRRYAKESMSSWLHIFQLKAAVIVWGQNDSFTQGIAPPDPLSNLTGLGRPRSELGLSVLAGAVKKI